MKPNNRQRAGSSADSKPDPEFIAQQLRRPFGDFAPQIGEKMNQVNEPLYDLMLDVMPLEDGDRVLEIGFGNGRFFNKLFERANALQVSGIDFSEAMVGAAKKWNRDAVSSGKLNIELGSSDALPFPDQTFDAVFCGMVVYFWDRPEEHLKEVHRVLKPEGKFYTGIRTRETMLAFPFVEYEFNLYSTDEWSAILEQNGFTVEQVHKKPDPEMDLEGDKLCLESCCIVADKGEMSH